MARGPRLPVPSRRVRRALILPPADAGSLGDEAMLVALVDQLSADGWRPTIASYGPQAPWSRHPSLGLRADVDHVRTAGAAGRLRLGRALLGATRVDCLGADVLDGHYQVSSATRRLLVVHVAARLGKQCALHSLSLDHDPPVAVRRRFRRLPASVEIRVRDPRSAQRIEAITGRPANLVADLGFLLESEASSATDAIDQWIGEQHERGRLVVGVNVDAVLGRRDDDPRAGDVVPFFAAGLASAAARDDLAFVFIPHDYRRDGATPSDEQLGEGLQRALQHRTGASLAARSRLPAAELTAKEARLVAGRLDALVTGRTHLAIAGLSQGVPTVVVGVAPTVAALEPHFDLGGLVVEPDASPARLALALDRALTRAQEPAPI